MFSGVRRRMSYANVVATLAMVFAMSGGALAASKFLITSTKQIKPSVLSQLKGKAGANGAPGAAGPAGSAGPQGPAGGPGKDGAAGANGTNGKDGESVTSASLKAGEGGCVEGGSKFTVGGKETKACNGEKGAKGVAGEPWTPNNVLPSEATETGIWSFGQGNSYPVVASFPIPLAKPLVNAEECGEAGHPTCVVHIMKLGEKSSECPGTVTEPQAAPGNLCVYEQEVHTVAMALLLPDQSAEGAGETGAIADAIPLGEEPYAFGTWAVTAE